MSFLDIGSRGADYIRALADFGKSLFKGRASERKSSEAGERKSVEPKDGESPYHDASDAPVAVDTFMPERSESAEPPVLEGETHILQDEAPIRQNDISISQDEAPAGQFEASPITEDRTPLNTIAELTPRTIAALKRNGIETLEELREENAESLAGLRGIGIGRIEEILSVIGDGTQAEDGNGQRQAEPSIATQTNDIHNDAGKIGSHPEDASIDLAHKKFDGIHDARDRKGRPIRTPSITACRAAVDIANSASCKLDSTWRNKNLAGSPLRAAHPIAASDGCMGGTQYVFDFDDISLLDLGARAENALRMCEVDNVAELIGRISDLKGMRGIGATSVERVKGALRSASRPIWPDLSDDTIERLRSYYGPEGFAFDLFGTLVRLPDAKPSFAGEDIPVESAEILSVRARHALLNAGIRTAGDLAGLSNDRLLSIRNFGAKSISEARRFLEDCGFNEDSGALFSRERNTVPKKNALDTLIAAFGSEALNAAEGSIRRLQSRGAHINRESFLLICLPALAYPSTDLDTVAADLCSRIAESDECEDRIPYMRKQLTADSRSNLSASELPEGMERDGKIVSSTESAQNESYRDVRESSSDTALPTFSEWLGSLPESEQEMIRDRIAGRTLAEIGDALGLTRERVRQKVVAVLKTVPQLAEDRLVECYIGYRWTIELFRIVFGVDVEGAWYLNEVTKRDPRRRDAKPCEVALSDNALTAEEHRKLELELEMIAEAHTVEIAGRRVEVDRRKIIHRLMQVYAVDGWITLERLLSLFREVISEKGLLGKRRLDFTSEHAFDAYLDNDPSILVVPYPHSRMPEHGNIKWFPPNEMPLWTLVSCLEQFSEANIECSCIAFFDRDKAGALIRYSMSAYEEAVEEIQRLGIADEYMLHRILRRYGEWMKGAKLTRAPHIRFGEGDAVDQALSIIRERPGIGISELARTYESLYGVTSGVFAASHTSDLSAYSRGGRYYPVAEGEALSEKEVMFLTDRLSSLPHPYYPISLLRNEFRAKFGQGSGRRVNAQTLSTLGKGYGVDENLVVEDGLDLMDYFWYVIDQAGTFSVGDPGFEREVFSNHKFMRVLASMTGSLDVFAYDQRQYITLARLMEIDPSIDKPMFEDFIDAALAMVKPEVPFTIHQLLQHGLVHPADEFRRKQGYPLQFLDSVMSGATMSIGLRRASYNGQIVYLKSNSARKSFTVADLLAYVVDENGGLSEEALSKILTERYGFELPEDDLRRRLVAGGLFRYDDEKRYMYPD